MSTPTFEQVQKAAGQPLVRDAWDKLTPEQQRQYAAAFGVTFAPNGTKRGRPASPVLEIIREAYPHCSPRSQARIKRAMDILFNLGVDREVIVRIERLYLRPNGTFNAAGFEQHAEFIAAEELL